MTYTLKKHATFLIKAGFTHHFLSLLCFSLFLPLCQPPLSRQTPTPTSRSTVSPGTPAPVSAARPTHKCQNLFFICNTKSKTHLKS